MSAINKREQIWESNGFCRDEKGQAHFPDYKLQSGEMDPPTKRRK